MSVTAVASRKLLVYVQALSNKQRNWKKKRQIHHCISTQPNMSRNFCFDPSGPIRWRHVATSSGVHQLQPSFSKSTHICWKRKRQTFLLIVPFKATVWQRIVGVLLVVERMPKQVAHAFQSHALMPPKQSPCQQSSNFTCRRLLFFDNGRSLTKVAWAALCNGCRTRPASTSPSTSCSYCLTGLLTGAEISMESGVSLDTADELTTRATGCVSWTQSYRLLTSASSGQPIHIQWHLHLLFATSFSAG